MLKPGDSGRSRGRVVTLTKLVVSFAVIAVIGAGAALTGASATPSAGPDGPTSGSSPPVAPAVFRRASAACPSSDRSGKRDIPKPRPWQNDELQPRSRPRRLSRRATSERPRIRRRTACARLRQRRRPFAGTSSASTSRPGAPAGRPTPTATSARPTTSRRSTRRSGSSARRDGVRVAAFTFNTLWSAPAPAPLRQRQPGRPDGDYDPIGDRWFVADFAFAATAARRRSTSASPSRRRATPSPAAGTSTRSAPTTRRIRGSRTTRRWASGPTAST